MKTTGHFLTLFALSASTAALAQFEFSQVQYWAGAGADSSVLVVDFQDGTGASSFAWGYLHDGPVTAEIMLNDITVADPAFTAVTTGGFLGDATYGDHAGIGGSPDYWSTWSGNDQGGWDSNMGIGETVGNGGLFGCSYTDFNPAIEPGAAVPAAIPAGIHEVRAAVVQVWPQPATDILHVRSNAAGQQAVVLYDMAGGTMARETVNSAVATIDVRSLPAGMYVLQVGDAKRLIAVQ
ncbi:MAG: T9SS type A sorting domain-containing protein [Flavobacteriales bacterium]|jgi:hypothetical protein|nr:T9SS type A sorting domain-containing protein [Flavobacteriales bacterium]